MTRGGQDISLTTDPRRALGELASIVQELGLRVTDLENRLRSISYTAPDKLRSPDLRYADGVHWNPGSGEGYYEYRGGTWHKL